MDTIPLNQRNLKNISSPVKVPTYARDMLRPAIAHIGLGNFHRAHQAFFLDTLISTGLTSPGIFDLNLIADTLPLA